MTREVAQLTNNKYQNVVLVGAGNVCSDTKDDTIVINSFKNLISAAKLKHASVKVASICPRGDPEIPDYIDNVDTAVQGMCLDLSCTYWDSTDILKLYDRAINEGFYLLTYKGQNKVAKKLELRPAQTYIPYNVVTNQQNRHRTS